LLLELLSVLLDLDVDDESCCALLLRTTRKEAVIAGDNERVVTGKNADVMWVDDDRE